MADHHGAAGHAAGAGDDGFGKVLAVVSGGVALVVGIAMGLSASMGPIGVPMAFSGALWIIWALFYSSPATAADARRWPRSWRTLRHEPSRGGVSADTASGPTMGYEIRPLLEADLAALGDLLREGFHQPEGVFASAEVLRWKYLEPIGPEADDAPRSFVAIERGEDDRDGAERLVGHVGVCRRRWHGGGLPVDGITTLHMIDWYARPSSPGAGARLMLHAHRSSVVQYGFGGSEAGRNVIDRAGYRLVGLVPAYTRVLRPLPTPRVLLGAGIARGVIRAAKDAIAHFSERAEPPRPEARITLEPLTGVRDTDLAPALDALGRYALHATRSAAIFNHLLRYPPGGLTAWRLAQSGRTRGVALLRVDTRASPSGEGRIVECLTDDPNDPNLSHAALHACTLELARQGARQALAVAPVEPLGLALQRCGYRSRFGLEFRLRDREGRFPSNVSFHVNFMDADYAYA